MALVYATDLRFFDADEVERDAEPDRLVTHLADWARTEEPWTPGSRPGAKGGEVTIDTVGSPDGLPCGWRLVFRHLDPEEQGVAWVVVATVTHDVVGTFLGVRVERTRDDVLRPIRSNPKPPRFVRELLAEPGLVARDGEYPILATHMSIDREQAPGFSRFLLSPDRRLPVIAYTPRDDEVLDAHSFLSDSVGVAHVALINPEASWELSDLLPSGLSVYGGAARIWWPGLTDDAIKWNYPLWTSDRSASEVYRSVSASIRRVAVSTSPRDPRYAALEGRQRNTELERLRGEIATYEELLREVEPEAPGTNNGEAIELKRRLSDALEYQQLVESDLQQAEERAAEAEARVRLVEAERDEYKHRLLAARGGEDLVDPDDERREALRADIDRATDDLGRTSSPREYGFGASFIETLEALGSSYRDKVVRACCAIVSGEADLLRQRDDHPLRSGDASSAPPVVRRTDGAEARRAYVEKKTPQARRLHYWRLNDGSIEFASVNLHDDMSIPTT
jgi:hypothetical protein